MRRENFIDVSNLSSLELEYMASVARGRERFEFRIAKENTLRKKIKDFKSIPVLKHLRQMASEIILQFANLRHCNDILYGDGQGTNFVIRENKKTGKIFTVSTIANFESDEVEIFVSGPDINSNLEDIQEKLASNSSEYKWILIEKTNESLKYKVEWIDREYALCRISEDECYIHDMAEKYLNF